jgi:hypothetical protein
MGIFVRLHNVRQLKRALVRVIFPAAQLGNAVCAMKTVQYNADLLLL